MAHPDIVTILVDIAGSGPMRFVDWSAEKKAIDIASFYWESWKFREATACRPRLGVPEAFSRRIAFYREHLARYVEEGGADRAAPSTPGADGAAASTAGADGAAPTAGADGAAPSTAGGAKQP